jgi:uncharacterized membrane protein YedE/YeeE
VDFTHLIDWLGEPALLTAGGALTGLLFGFFAQRSRFCLRSAAIEFSRGRPGDRLAVWLLSFSTAVVTVQLLILAGALDVGTARQLATRGSLSGALVGGLLFGAGMIMTRGCASRLLVLSANGNLRALLSGLIFAVTAQAALAGALAPLRESISVWWTVEGGPTRDLLQVTHIGRWGGLAFALLWLAAAIWYAARSPRGFWKWAGGIGAGLMVAAGWWFTFSVSRSSFQVVPVHSLSFSGPSAEWLMRVLRAPFPEPGFDTGMLPGVFAGSFLGALAGRELHLEGFGDGYSMRRYIAGAILMGFGAMLAGGCAVGAGLSGGSVFAVTAWLTLVGMWSGAALTDRMLDAHPELRAP